jgi:FtsH-binding integral membrane protein
MNPFNQDPRYNTFRSQDTTNVTVSFMNQVYLWMMAGLILSGGTAFIVASTPEAINTILTNKILFWGIVILQFVAVIWLSARIQTMSMMFAGSLFLAYSILTGLTLSTIFIAFTKSSIASAFFISASSFLGLSVCGYATKRDLSAIGTFCMMGLFGVIGMMILGWIFPSIMSSGMQMAINVIGIIVFAGLTAYDTQKIKNLSMSGMTNEVAQKTAIHGALVLYLDFINLFLFILNIMGNRK